MPQANSSPNPPASAGTTDIVPSRIPWLGTPPALLSWGMGFERPYPRRLRGWRRPIPAHHAYLGDYAEMTSLLPEEDVEAEQCTWPELIDQTRLGRWCGRYDFDDVEDDDACGGDICDEPHDAREEDGI